MILFTRLLSFFTLIFMFSCSLCRSGGELYDGTSSYDIILFLDNDIRGGILFKANELCIKDPVLYLELMIKKKNVKKLLVNYKSKKVAKDESLLRELEKFCEINKIIINYKLPTSSSPSNIPKEEIPQDWIK